MARGGYLVLDCLIVGSDLTTVGMFVAVLLRLRESGTSAGLSLQTLIAIFSARLMHLGSHGWPIYLHYSPKVLPMAPYFLSDVATVMAGGASIWSILGRYYGTYELEKDNFGIQVLDKLGWIPKSGPFKHRPLAAATFLYFVVGVSAYLWYLVRWALPTFGVSVYCCLYEAMSAVALIPQLWMFHQDKKVQPTLAVFVVLVAVSRLFTLTFWVVFPWVFPWQVPANRGIQMAMEAFNILILSDFLYYWIRSRLRGDSEIVLGALDSTV